MQYPNRKTVCYRFATPNPIGGNDEKREQRTRGSKTKHQSVGTKSVRNYRSFPLLGTKRNCGELGRSENRKTANCSFASRNLLWHPLRETSVFIPVNQVGNREEDYTNVCNRKLSVDDTWRQREDCMEHLAEQVNGEGYQGRLSSHRRIHRFR